MSKKEKFNTEAALERLKAARAADPNWEKAIAEVVDAEAKHGKDDPCEGTPFIVTRFTRPKRSK